MPRYVLLYHDSDNLRNGSHWDLMLERDGALATWAISTVLDRWAGPLGLKPSGSDTVAAIRLAEHRIAYLDYEGPVSGERGTVRRVAEGEYEVASWESDRVVLQMQSGPLVGEARLARVNESDWSLTADD